MPAHGGQPGTLGDAAARNCWDRVGTPSPVVQVVTTSVSKDPKARNVVSSAPAQKYHGCH